MVFLHLPVANVGSAPSWPIRNLGIWRRSAEPLQRRASAASTPMQGLCAAVKLLHRPGRPSRPRAPYLLGHSGGKQAAALTWWWENVRSLRVTRWWIHSSAQSPGRARLTPSVAEPEYFHRGGQNETIAHTGVAHEQIFRIQIAVDLLVFLGINISPVSQVQPCHTIKFGYLNKLFIKKC